MNNHIRIPSPSKLDQIRVFGRKFIRRNSGKGLQQYGVNYACNGSREAYMRNYRAPLEIAICDHDIGSAAIKIGKDWHLAFAIQPGFDGVHLENWLRVSRELRQKNKAKAKINYSSVQRALGRISEIDRLASARARIRPKPITAAQESEYYERQFIGLSVSVPEELEDLVRNDDGLLGTVISSDDPEENQVNQYTPLPVAIAKRFYFDHAVWL